MTSRLAFDSTAMRCLQRREHGLIAIGQRKTLTHLRILLAVLLAMAGRHAIAGTISVKDWSGASPGNNLLMYDSATNLGWLNLTVTNMKSYNSVAAELGSAGAYAGFQYASTAQIDQLFTNAGLSAPFDGSTDQNLAAANLLLGYWGETQAGPFGGSQFITAGSTFPGTHEVGALYPPKAYNGDSDNFRPAWSDTASGTTIASALVMFMTPAPVPEIDPATGGSALSLVAGVLAMIEQRRRRATLVA